MAVNGLLTDYAYCNPDIRENYNCYAIQIMDTVMYTLATDKTYNAYISPMQKV